MVDLRIWRFGRYLPPWPGPYTVIPALVKYPRKKYLVSEYISETKKMFSNCGWNLFFSCRILWEFANCGFTVFAIWFYIRTVQPMTNKFDQKKTDFCSLRQIKLNNKKNITPSAWLIKVLILFFGIQRLFVSIQMQQL